MVWGDCGSKIRGWWGRRRLRITTAGFRLPSILLRALSLLSFRFLLSLDFLSRGRLIVFEHATKLFQLSPIFISSTSLGFGKIFQILIAFSYYFSTICRISTELLIPRILASSRGMTHVLTVWHIMCFTKLAWSGFLWNLTFFFREGSGAAPSSFWEDAYFFFRSSLAAHCSKSRRSILWRLSSQSWSSMASRSDQSVFRS